MSESWSNSSLGDLAIHIRNGINCDQSSKADKLVAVSRIETISNGKIDFERVGYAKYEEKLNKYLLQKNDILFSHINSVKHIGKVAIVNGTPPLYHAINLMAIRPNQDKVYPQYLFSYLKWDKSKKYFERSCKQAINQASLNTTDINTYKVLLPPLHEQTKIAEILTSVDDVIELTEKEIEKLQMLKKGMMQDLLTKGIGHTKFKGSPVGRIPESWECVQIQQVMKLVNGRGFKPHEWKKSGLPIIRIQNLNGSDEFNYYNGEYDKKIEVNYEELLFAWSGSRGTSFGPHIWYGGKGVLNYHTWKVMPDEEKISKRFTLHLLRKITEQIENDAHGASALVHMQKWAMEEYVVPFPPHEEQQRIAQGLDNLDLGIKAKYKKLKSQVGLKKALMSDLLTGKVRVKV